MTVDLTRLIKPLEWDDSLKGRWIGAPQVKFANYARWIFQVDGQFHYVNNDKVLAKYPTLAAAQAAANADNAARVLAAIETNAIAELVEACDQTLDAFCVLEDSAQIAAVDALNATLAKLKGAKP